MFKRLFIAVVLLVLIVGGIVGFNQFRSKMIAEFFAGMTPPPVPVATVEVQPIVWDSGIDAIGTALSAQGVDLAVQAAGLVRSVDFKANDHVTKDQVLVKIDERIEQADLRAAVAAAELAETELARSRTLQERGISTANTLEVAEAQATNARSQVARLTALLDQKELTAPFAAVIGIPQVEAGQYVIPGTVFATLQNLDQMQVDFTVPEQQITQVAIGTLITVSSEVGGLTFNGTITAIEPQVDPSSRLVSVRGSVEGTDGKLLPGQFLRVRIKLPPEPDVIALPQTAVTSNLYGDAVFVVRGDAEDALSVEQVFVTTGRRSGGMVEVAQGIKPGDRVVAAGQNRLTGGAKVVIDNSVVPAATTE